MAQKPRTVDLLVGAFDLDHRRKFTIKDSEGKVVLDLYFKAVTRADRMRANAVANTDDALVLSTQMLCQMAELKDGTKAFHMADAPKLQRELPEKVLNEIELFLFNVDETGKTLEEVKND
tara:strand:+ start:1082 stop:1441 length:360 start_codon:yes stop_codon:yes gene_type:complete